MEEIQTPSPPTNPTLKPDSKYVKTIFDVDGNIQVVFALKDFLKATYPKDSFRHRPLSKSFSLLVNAKKQIHLVIDKGQTSYSSATVTTDHWRGGYALKASVHSPKMLRASRPLNLVHLMPFLQPHNPKHWYAEQRQMQVMENHIWNALWSRALPHLDQEALRITRRLTANMNIYNLLLQDAENPSLSLLRKYQLAPGAAALAITMLRNISGVFAEQLLSLPMEEMVKTLLILQGNTYNHPEIYQWQQQSSWNQPEISPNSNFSAILSWAKKVPLSPLYGVTPRTTPLIAHSLLEVDPNLLNNLVKPEHWRLFHWACVVNSKPLQTAILSNPDACVKTLRKIKKSLPAELLFSSKILWLNFAKQIKAIEAENKDPLPVTQAQSLELILDYIKTWQKAAFQDPHLHPRLKGQYFGSNSSQALSYGTLKIVPIQTPADLLKRTLKINLAKKPSYKHSLSIDSPPYLLTSEGKSIGIAFISKHSKTIDIYTSFNLDFTNSCQGKIKRFMNHIYKNGLLSNQGSQFQSTRVQLATNRVRASTRTTQTKARVTRL